jgi:hypothetical protein
MVGKDVDNITETLNRILFPTLGASFSISPPIPEYDFSRNNSNANVDINVLQRRAVISAAGVPIHTPRRHALL